MSFFYFFTYYSQSEIFIDILREYFTFEQNTNSSILLVLLLVMNLTQYIIVFIKIEFRQFINV